MLAGIPFRAAFFLVIGVLLVATGIFRVRRPARALDWDYRWDRASLRVFTLGRVRSPGPLMSESEGRRVTVVVGVASIVCGTACLVVGAVSLT